MLGNRHVNLCKSWPMAALNIHGRFTTNRIDIDVRKSRTTIYPRVTIFCALDFPKVFYSFDVIGSEGGGGGLPGKGSRSFDVHDNLEHAAWQVEQDLRHKITKDHKIPDKMIVDAIEGFRNAVMSDKAEEEYMTICACCGKRISNTDILYYENKELCVDCWENHAFDDDDDNVDKENT